MNRKEKLKRIFTLANILSISRIFMAIPLVMALDKGWFDESIRYQVCGGIILAIFLSDILDGMVARWLDQVSNLGKIIDPVADKICMMVVLIYLIKEFGDPFFLFFLLITSRDTILIIVGILWSLGLLLLIFIRRKKFGVLEYSFLVNLSRFKSI